LCAPKKTLLFQTKVVIEFLKTLKKFTKNPATINMTKYVVGKLGWIVVGIFMDKAFNY